MKKFFTLILSYSIFFNSAFANGPKTNVVKTGKTSLIIRSYVREYSKKIEQDIQKYNKVRRDPASFLKTFPQKEEKVFLNLLKEYKTKELPEVKKENGSYIIQAQNGKIEFNLVDSFNNQIRYNNKIYKFKNVGLESENKSLQEFFGMTNKKSSFISNLFLDEAQAFIGGGLLFVAVLAVGALAMTSIFAHGNDKLELGNQLKSMKEEISNLEMQCQEDIQFVGKPEEVKETLSVLSLFMEDNKFQEDALESHLYAKLAGKSKEYQDVKENDPVNCYDFTKLLKDTTYTATDFKMEKNGVNEDLTTSLCETHDSLKKCLKDFHDKFRSSNGSRSIEDFIENYEPHNHLLKKSIDK